MPKFITAYGPKLKVALSFPEGEGRTKQSFKDDSDINNIMARFKKTGLIDYVSKNEPRYGDVRAVDFHQAMNLVAHGKSMFHSLPAHIREKFRNDPARFLEFVQNPANQEEAIQLGLVRRKPEEVPEYADQAAQEERGDAPGAARAPKGEPAAEAARDAQKPPSGGKKGGQTKDST